MVDYKKIILRLIKNWPAKVLSIVAAIFLFAFHRMSDLEDRFFTVPLHLDIAGNLLPGTVYPQNVRVSLRGTNAIYNISETDIEAHLDLTRYTEPGIYKTQIHIQRKGSAAEIEILEITVEPAELTVELDTRISKTVPILPDFHGYLEQGFEMVSFILEPAYVVIEGPEKLVLSVSEIQTESIDIQDRNTDFSVNVSLLNPNQLVRIRGDNGAEFICKIKELIIINSFDNLPVNAMGLDSTLDAILEPPRASIRFNAVQSMLEEINAGMVSLYVDCSGISESGFYELSLLVETAKEINIDKREPEIIRVEIRQKTAQ